MVKTIACGKIPEIKRFIEESEPINIEYLIGSLIIKIYQWAESNDYTIINIVQYTPYIHFVDFIIVYK